MADGNVIVVKRIKKIVHGHHGGAWKIAYADFVTAMMAFFLLMWLLGTLSAGDLKGVEEYFKTPLKVALMGGPAVGGSQSVLKGGGKDLTQQAGQVRKAEGKESIKKIDIKSAKAELERLEKQKLEDLKQKLQQAIDASPTMNQFKNQLLLDITTEGLRIQIVDDQNRPMFASSKAELQPYARQILHEIGQVLNGLPNKISLSGHTDASPYPNGEKLYSNWELSSDRANAARRELVAGGIDETKLLRVVGLSSAVLFDRANPLNPVNRRISIIVMNKKAEEDVLNDDAAVKVNSNTVPGVESLSPN
ncbi:MULTISPECIES: flagellar motor protein MotB [Methylotenera]|uniref:flagellar motor protein MotB n=1 Tax=Methylotenera TaxID=359407 RepID=UPI000375448A|nr:MULTISPECIES: flagellar motor protein MotB [Methylotenera]